jgi:hypothetical protein
MCVIKSRSACIEGIYLTIVEIAIQQSSTAGFEITCNVTLKWSNE